MLGARLGGLLYADRLRIGDEALNPIPCVGRSCGKLSRFAVEKAVRRPGIDAELVRDMSCLEGLLELVDGLLRDALVSAAEQAQDRILDLACPVKGRGDRTEVTSQPSIKANGAREIVATRARPEGERASHAEAQGEGGERA